MTTNPFKTCFRCDWLFAAALALIPAAAPAAETGPASTGSISGLVSSTATRNMLQGAIVAIPSLNRQAVTDANGAFLLEGLPQGPVEVTVSYKDFEEQQLPVDVGSDAARHMAVMLKPAEIVAMEAYLVPATIEGQSLAVTKEENAPRLENVLALDSDISATVPNYNVGELATRLPGVAANYSQGTVNELFIRGMPNTLTRLTFDGLDSIAAIDGRRPTYTVFSGSLFQDLELIKGQTPEMSADSIGGTLNLITPSPLSMTDNLRVDYDGGLVYTPNYSDYLTPQQRERDVQPFISLGYQEVFSVLGGHRNLGVLLRAFYGENQYDIGQLTYNYQPNMPNSPAYIWDDRAQDSMNDRHVSGVNFKVEYRPSDTSKFFFSFLANLEQEPSIELQSTRAFTNETIATVGANGAPVAGNTGAILPGYTDNMTQVLPVSGSNFVIRDYDLGDDNRNQIFTAGGTHTFGGWTIDYTGRYDLEHYNDTNGNDGTGGDLSMTDPTIGYTLNRTTMDNPVLTQTAGPSIYNLSSYTNSVTFTERRDTLDNDILEGVANAAYQFDTKYPITLKTGIEMKNDEYKIDQRDPRQWTPVAGSDFLPAGSIWYMPPTPYTEGLPMVDARAVNLLVSNPALWTENVYYRAMEDYQSYGVTENIEAEYVQGQIKLGKLTVLSGVRYEETQDVGNSYIEVPAATAAQIPDPVARAIHDWDHPVENRGSYTRPFPSVHLTYDILDNLVARASWSTSFGRPPFTDLTPKATISSTADTVTVGNPGLGPEYSRNIDLALAYYFTPAGEFSAGYFRKNISDYIESENVGIVGSGPNNGYQGNYAGYNLLSDVNLGSADVAGWEFGYRQQLTFLPGPLKGLELSGNYTTLTAEGNYGGTTTINGSQVANFVPRTAMASLAYRYRRYGTRIIFQYQSPYLFTASATPSAEVFQDRRSTVSLNLNYRIMPEASIYTQINNLFQQTQDQYIYEPYRLDTRQFVNAAIQVGVKGQF